MFRLYLAVFSFMFFLAGCAGSDGSGDSGNTDTAVLKIDLGEKLFKDTSLSTPAGQACASCHVESAAFTDPDVMNTNPVSEGANGGVFGNRNAPTAAYAAFIPAFSRVDGEYIGGQFLDGRAATLADQAKGPFLNPKEMANENAAEVIGKILNASYASQFKEVYGQNSLDDVDTAYDFMADAIAAFESTEKFSPFSSKFDAVMAGTASFTAAEQRGFDLFKKTGAGKCEECHTLDTPSGAAGPLFTNFKYFNIGVPINPGNPDKNIDIGLAANPALTTSAALEKGKFRVPTLRNVAVTAPYMHNGALQTLEQVVRFYSDRDDKRCYPDTPVLTLSETNCWPEPEVGDNMDITFTGSLFLSDTQISDLVAFLQTLTDGYQP